MSYRCPHNIVKFGPLAAEIGLPVWGTPANFNGFRVYAALLRGSQVAPRKSFDILALYKSDYYYYYY